MDWVYNDGGRSKAGFKGSTGDCVVRAFAIMTGKPYIDVYNEINALGLTERITKRKKDRSNSRTGVYVSTTRKYAKSLGLVWVPTMYLGSGCKIHLKASELPKGRIIAKVSKHCVAVIDGVIHDTHDCSRNETRCVYGYYQY